MRFNWIQATCEQGAPWDLEPPSAIPRQGRHFTHPCPNNGTLLESRSPSSPGDPDPGPACLRGVRNGVGQGWALWGCYYFLSYCFSSGYAAASGWLAASIQCGHKLMVQLILISKLPILIIQVFLHRGRGITKTKNGCRQNRLILYQKRIQQQAKFLKKKYGQC